MTPNIYLTPIARISDPTPATPRRTRGAQSAPAKNAVIAALRSGHATAVAIAHNIGRSPESARQALYALEQDGVVERAGKSLSPRGRYIDAWRIQEPK